MTHWVEDEGATRLNKIMKDEKFPEWIHGTGRFEPGWTLDLMELSDKVVLNTYEELKISEREHEKWRCDNGEERRRKRAAGEWVSSHRQTQAQGWLDRKAIWNRACRVGAVASMVLKIGGMILTPRPDGSIDRCSAANLLRGTLIASSAEYGGLKKMILDVVCSQADREPAQTGVSKCTCTFYVRFPAWMATVAKDTWIPRICTMRICECQVTAYLMFRNGKEALHESKSSEGWKVTVDGISPPPMEYDPGFVQNSGYNPDNPETEKFKAKALSHSQEYLQRLEYGDSEFAWAKGLQGWMLQYHKGVPAIQEEKVKLEAGLTWQYWLHFKSGDPHQIWKAMYSLMNAGQGEQIGNQWVKRGETPYSLFAPEREKDGEDWAGGDKHLELLVGEVAMTLDKAHLLTYMNDQGQLIQRWGVMALAVKSTPMFSIRNCSTYHQISPKNELCAMEYQLMHKSIKTLHDRGLSYLANLMMGNAVIQEVSATVSEQPQYVQVLSPVDKLLPMVKTKDEEQVHLHMVNPADLPVHTRTVQTPEVSLIDLQTVTQTDLNNTSTASITALPNGTALPNVQIDPRVQERWAARMREIEKCCNEERKIFSQLKKTLEEKAQELEDTFMLEVTKVKWTNSLRKYEFLDNMRMETALQTEKLYGEFPAADWINEMRIKIAPLEKELSQNEMKAQDESRVRMTETYHKAMNERVIETSSSCAASVTGTGEWCQVAIDPVATEENF